MITEQVIVRPGMMSDLDAAIEILGEFREESLKYFGFSKPFAKDYLSQFVEDSFVLEIDGRVVGISAGKIIQSQVDGQLIYDEVVWYVLREFRGYGLRLMDALEARCRERGIKHMACSLMGNSMSERLHKFYTRRGFEVMEIHYIKELR